MKGGPFGLCFRGPDSASVVLVVSVKSGPISVRSEVWRKEKVNVRVGHFLFHEKRQLKYRWKTCSHVIEHDRKVPQPPRSRDQFLFRLQLATIFRF